MLVISISTEHLDQNNFPPGINEVFLILILIRLHNNYLKYNVN